MRAVGHAERRAGEASRLGFSNCSLPRAGLDRLSHLKGEIALHGAGTLRDAVDQWLPGAIRDRNEGAGGGPVSGAGSASGPGARKFSANSRPGNMSGGRFPNPAAAQTDPEAFEPEM